MQRWPDFQSSKSPVFPFSFFFLSIFLEKGKQSDLRMLTIATMESWLRRNVSFNARQELNFTTTEWLINQRCMKGTWIDDGCLDVRERFSYPNEMMLHDTYSTMIIYTTFIACQTFDPIPNHWTDLRHSEEDNLIATNYIRIRFKEPFVDRLLFTWTCILNVRKSVLESV